MFNVNQSPTAAQAEQLKNTSVNAKQKALIDDLKHMGLLNKPNFSLAYGPTASTNNSR